ncbi:MAG: beta-aspartyl-peptidase [Sporomusaceae bacterium]|nr:beta-aspartyl-peptidase [Sporomusaceae bacterium]
MPEETFFFTLLQGARIFSPQELGTQDLLLAGEKVAAIGQNLDFLPEKYCRRIDATGKWLVPGLIDGHIHLIGGGGEGGYHTRTPEVVLSDLTRAGITTVVGCLGTDGTMRHMSSLLAKVRALEIEGLSAYLYTGAYEVPGPTLTGSVRSDLLFIDKVLGAGEVAISDHRSSQPTVTELLKLVAEARNGGLLSGKAGIVHCHIGDGHEALKPLFAIIKGGEIPITQLVPTHVNRNPYLLQEAFRWGRLGGVIDMTSGVYPSEGCWEALRASQAIMRALAAKVPLDRITMSSDGNGSLPVFDEAGAPVSLAVATPQTLWEEIRDLWQNEGLPLAMALAVATSNIAKVLKLWPQKGEIQVGSDADFLVVTPDLTIEQVWARGQQMIAQGEILQRGTFENRG